MNLKERMELAGQCLLALPEPKEEYLIVGGHEVAHDTGRWWDAVLRLEEAIGFTIPTELEESMLCNFQWLTDNPDGLLMNRPDIAATREEAKIDPHNFREGLLAFTALVHYRKNAWAEEAGHRLLETMDRCLEDDGRLDVTKLKCWGDIPFTPDPCQRATDTVEWCHTTISSGRSLEAVVGFYKETADDLALDVAPRIAQRHLTHFTNPDGTIRKEITDPKNRGHNHSLHGTLRGLYLYGRLTSQREFTEAVSATYRNGLRESVVKESGWMPHDMGMTMWPNDEGDPYAETASVGDSAQMALWLAMDLGHQDLLDDVERLVRARIFPAQITPDDARANPDREFTPKQIGGWGSHRPAHAATRCLPDVVAAVSHSLCDIYNHVCTRSSLGLSVNFHFDCEDDAVKVTAAGGAAPSHRRCEATRKYLRSTTQVDAP